MTIIEAYWIGWATGTFFTAVGMALVACFSNRRA